MKRCLRASSFVSIVLLTPALAYAQVLQPSGAAQGGTSAQRPLPPRNVSPAPTAVTAPGGMATSPNKPHTLGIGSITLRQDGTDVSFDAAAYFSRVPLSVNGVPARAYVVDFATDAEWQVSGEIVGSAQVRYDPSGVEFWGSALAYSAVPLSLLGGGLLVGAASGPDSGPMGAIGAGFLAGGVVLGVVEYALLRRAADHTQTLQMALGGLFNVRRDGRLYTTLQVAPIRIERHQELWTRELASRSAVLAPVFASLGPQLASLMAKDSPGVTGTGR